MNTPVDFLKLRIQALILTKISQSDRDIIEHFYKQAKELEKQQLSNAFYALTDIQTPKNFDDYYNETFKPE